MSRSPDDVPLTIAQLAQESGLSKTTLRNWASLPDRPLERVPGRPQLHTWAQLFDFCATHEGRYKAPRIAALRRRATVPGAGRRRKALADEHLMAIVEAVRAAELTARAHREQLEALLVAYGDGA